MNKQNFPILTQLLNEVNIFDYNTLIKNNVNLVNNTK